MADYNLPDELCYSRDDEWIRAEHEGRHRIGITDYAQQQLGDIVFVELPEVGAHFEAGQPFGVIESVKAVSDLHAPIAIEVLEVNGALEDAPETVNTGCYDDGWLIVARARVPDEINNLLDITAYRTHIDDRTE